MTFFKAELTERMKILLAPRGDTNMCRKYCAAQSFVISDHGEARSDERAPVPEAGHSGSPRLAQDPPL